MPVCSDINGLSPLLLTPENEVNTHGCWCHGSSNCPVISRRYIDYIYVIKSSCFPHWRISMACAFSVLRNNRCKYSLTHWGRVTHICVSDLTSIDSDNGLSPGRRQAIIRTNAGILLIGTLGTIFSEILIGIHTFSFKKMHLKISSGKRRPFWPGLNVLMFAKIYSA